MKQSEFWDALEQVFGPALGHSLAQDLYLPRLKGTAQEALESGLTPDTVWEALVEESDAGEEARWVHRRPLRKNRG